MRFGEVCPNSNKILWSARCKTNVKYRDFESVDLSGVVGEVILYMKDLSLQECGNLLLGASKIQASRAKKLESDVRRLWNLMRSVSVARSLEEPQDSILLDTGKDINFKSTAVGRTRYLAPTAMSSVGIETMEEGLGLVGWEYSKTSIMEINEAEIETLLSTERKDAPDAHLTDIYHNNQDELNKDLERHGPSFNDFYKGLDGNVSPQDGDLFVNAEMEGIFAEEDQEITPATQFTMSDARSEGSPSFAESQATTFQAPAKKRKRRIRLYDVTTKLPTTVSDRDEYLLRNTRFHTKKQTVAIEYNLLELEQERYYSRKVKTTFDALQEMAMTRFKDNMQPRRTMENMEKFFLDSNSSDGRTARHQVPEIEIHPPTEMIDSSVPTFSNEDVEVREKNVSDVNVEQSASDLEIRDLSNAVVSMEISGQAENSKRREANTLGPALDDGVGEPVRSVLAEAESRAATAQRVAESPDEIKDWILSKLAERKRGEPNKNWFSFNKMTWELTRIQKAKYFEVLLSMLAAQQLVAKNVKPGVVLLKLPA